MRVVHAALALTLSGAVPLAAQSPASVTYRLSVSAHDTSGVWVTMHIARAPSTFRLAMAVHPEYNDRYWRFIESLTVMPHTRRISAATPNTWTVQGNGSDVTIRYRMRYPQVEPAQRAAWRPFLTSTGGLVGDLHTFMYLVGREAQPTDVTLDLPPSWTVATQLTAIGTHRFHAVSVDDLMDGPFLIGRLHHWHFESHGTPHEIAYWPATDAPITDSATLIQRTKAVVDEAITLFGHAAYRRYSFLLQDRAYGALEHRNSVTLGAPRDELSSANLLTDLAHEYFHAWNLMRIHPVEYLGVSYQLQDRTAGLWWGEGLTMFYADLLVRRAHLPAEEPTRTAHLEALIARYFENSGNYLLSPEEVSRLEYGSTAADYGNDNASTHLQGELIGNLLDIMIRDSTHDTRSIDDVMRLMLRRYSGERGFRNDDVQAVVDEVCGCHTRDFFDRYVRQATPLAFDRGLEPIGMRIDTITGVATDSSGKPRPDLEAWALTIPQSRPLLRIFDRNSVWSRAGLHTADTLISIDSISITSLQDFRRATAVIHVGDSVHVTVGTREGRRTHDFIMSPQRQTRVLLLSIPKPSPDQLRRRSAWESGH